MEHWLLQREAIHRLRKMRKISLIIPVYNTREYLEKCLESAVSQDYGNMEIICVDDGSSDGSGQILDRFAKECGNIIAIHQRNGGESNARNRGLAAASGDYIGFMDCDDWIETGMYSELCDALESYDVDMAASGWVKEFPGQSIVVRNQGQVRHGVIEQGELLEYVYHRDKYQGFAYIWNKLYKREALYDKRRDFLKFDENLRLGGDILYLAQILMNVKSAVYMDESFYHYRQRDESGSHSRNVEARLDSLRAYDYVIDLFQEHHIEEEVLKLVKRFQVYHSTNIAEIAFQNRDKKALDACHRYMRRYKEEYIETNQEHAERIARFYHILEYQIEMQKEDLA